MKENYQRTRTRFFSKYGGLSIYDINTENIYSIDYKGIHFVKVDRYALIDNSDHPDVTSTDHDFF